MSPGIMTPGDLLRFPQALSIRERPDEAEGADERVAERVEEAVAAALDELDTMRVREGGYLRADLDARRARARRRCSSAPHAAAEEGMAALQARLEERVRELRADALADEGTIAQEIAKFVGRSDVTEEVVRFRGHLEHWRALIGVARAVRPEAGLPDSGDESRGQHAGIEGGRARGVGSHRGAQGRAREDARAGAECRVKRG